MKLSRWTYFGDDEWLAVLQSPFQREAPRSSAAQLDLNVVEGDELLHGLHGLHGPVSVYPCGGFRRFLSVLR